MSSENFPRAYELVLVHEGGYVNHPRDPGGATNKGVTQNTYNAYRRHKRQSARSVRHITNSELIDIYRSRYWDAVKGDELPSGLDYVIYRALTSALRPEKEDRRASIQQPCLLNPRHVA